MGQVGNLQVVGGMDTVCGYSKVGQNRIMVEQTAISDYVGTGCEECDKLCRLWISAPIAPGKVVDTI